MVLHAGLKKTLCELTILFHLLKFYMMNIRVAPILQRFIYMVIYLSKAKRTG